MKRMRFVQTFAMCLCLLGGSALPAGNALKSSLQPGEKIPGAFHPLNVTGNYAGDKHCLVCEYGLAPVAMIFAREVDEPLVRLIAKIDAATTQNARQEMGSFVVFLSSEEGLDKKLKDVAAKKALKSIVLSIEHPAGPEDFKVAKKAAVTVVLYTDHTVKANHAFAKGELTDQAIEKIIADIPKIVGKK